nr:MAG TPA: zinc-ribbon domain protein [Bacteriophage sp.]
MSLSCRRCGNISSKQKNPPMLQTEHRGFLFVCRISSKM